MVTARVTVAGLAGSPPLWMSESGIPKEAGGHGFGTGQPETAHGPSCRDLGQGSSMFRVRIPHMQRP